MDIAGRDLVITDVLLNVATDTRSSTMVMRLQDILTTIKDTSFQEFRTDALE
jgi:hypothetical protein